MASITLTAIEGIPMSSAGDNLAELIAQGLDQSGLTLQNGDIIIVCQKSRVEGRRPDGRAQEYRALCRSPNSSLRDGKKIRARSSWCCDRPAASCAWTMRS